MRANAARASTPRQIDVLEHAQPRQRSHHGGIRDPKTVVPLVLSPVHAYLRRVAGANDDLVPIDSQYWAFVIARLGDTAGAIAQRASVGT